MRLDLSFAFAIQDTLSNATSASVCFPFFLSFHVDPPWHTMRKDVDDIFALFNQITTSANRNNSRRATMAHASIRSVPTAATVPKAIIRSMTPAMVLIIFLTLYGTYI